MERLEISHFAPPERASMRKIEEQHRMLAADPILVKLLDCFAEPAAVLNVERQIVFANDKFANMIGRGRTELLGLRPGEALACIHADEEPCGCGTSKFCRLCGAAQVIMTSQASRAQETEECRITCRRPEGLAALDLRVWSTPLEVRGESFTVFAIHDTTDEKRREALERVFFHDVLNTAGGLRGILELWPEVGGEEAIALTEQARTLAGLVIDEIEAQRDLVGAENGDLVVNLRAFDVAPLLVRLCLLYSRLTMEQGGMILPPEFSGSTLIRTDDVILSRILGNLIKNAIEASSRGQKIRVSFVNLGAPTFHIHNESFMPEDVQLQIFQRSFSTKVGTGHGIGSYSVKLLTERYLEGWVTFSSSHTAGTTFTVTLPG